MATAAKDRRSPAHAARGTASSRLCRSAWLSSTPAARDEPFVCLAADSRLHAILTGAAAAEGFIPRIEFETYGPASIRELVAAGLGVALLARSAAEGPGAAVGVCELARPPEHPPIGLIRSRARPLIPAARAFWDHLAATAGGTGGEPRRAAAG